METTLKHFKLEKERRIKAEDEKKSIASKWGKDTQDLNRVVKLLRDLNDERIIANNVLKQEIQQLKAEHQNGNKRLQIQANIISQQRSDIKELTKKLKITEGENQLWQETFDDLMSKDHNRAPETMGKEDMGRTRTELADELSRVNHALKKVTDNLVSTKNQVWNAVVMLSASGTPMCDAGWELPTIEDQVKETVSRRSYLTCLRVAKYFYHELLMAKAQGHELSRLLSADYTYAAYLRVLGEYALLVKRLMVANIGTFPGQAPGLDTRFRMDGICPTEKGDFEHWKLVIFDFLELNGSVPRARTDPNSPAALMMEDRFAGWGRYDAKIHIDLELVETVIEKMRERQLVHQVQYREADGVQEEVPSMSPVIQHSLKKMVLLPKRVLDAWVHGPPHLVKHLVQYLRLMEHSKMEFWEDMHQRKGVFRFDWPKYFTEMKERGKARSESTNDGGGDWLALREDIQIADPPSGFHWKHDNTVGTDTKEMCVRCTNIKQWEKEFADKWGVPEDWLSGVDPGLGLKFEKPTHQDMEAENKAPEDTMTLPASEDAKRSSHTGYEESQETETDGEVGYANADNKKGKSSGDDKGTGAKLKGSTEVKDWGKNERGVYIEHGMAEEDQRGETELHKCSCQGNEDVWDYGPCQRCEQKQEGEGKEKA